MAAPGSAETEPVKPESDNVNFPTREKSVPFLSGMHIIR